MTLWSIAIKELQELLRWRGSGDVPANAIYRARYLEAQPVGTSKVYDLAVDP